jgi:tRNA(fMet)-specific endonuclease VapC
MGPTVICVDTDFCVDYLRGKSPRCTQFENALARFDLRMTAITAYELLLGQLRMRRWQDLTGLLEVVPVIPFGRRAAEESARTHSTLMKKGQEIGLPDTLIAGICLAEAIPLLTYNLAHFERVEGLKVIDPNTL